MGLVGTLKDSVSFGRHLWFGIAIGAAFTALSRPYGWLTDIPAKEAGYIYLFGIVCAVTWLAIIIEPLITQHCEKRRQAQQIKRLRESVREDMKALEVEHRVALRWMVHHNKQQVLENRRNRILEDLAGLKVLEDGATRSQYKYRVPDWIWNELKHQKWSEEVPRSVRRILESELPPWHQSAGNGANWTR